MRINHLGHDHPNTAAARAACRKAMKKGNAPKEAPKVLRELLTLEEDVPFRCTTDETHEHKSAGEAAACSHEAAKAEELLPAGRVGKGVAVHLMMLPAPGSGGRGHREGRERLLRR